VNGATLLRGLLGPVVVAGLLSLSPNASTAAGAIATSPVVNVWSEPSSGYGFIDAAIASSKRSIELSMYELSDTTIERLLIARAAAGVDVRVLLNADYEGTRHNASADALLRASRVHVEWAPTDQIFHAKYLIVDERAAYIGTGNLEMVDYASTRDFWVEDVRAADVSAVEKTFDADFARTYATTPSGGLVWSPGSGSTLVALIDSAHRSVLVENEEMDSAGIEAALDAAARRGVSVKVVMTRSSSWTAAQDDLARHGVLVRVLSSFQVYIHAKVICVDCVAGEGTVFIGSENFSTSSLSYNRELGVITTTPKAVRDVDTAVNDDFAVGTPVTVARVTTTNSSGTSALRITSFVGALSPGAEDSLSVHSTKADDSCDLEITLTSGYVSESHGLGRARGNASGNATWTWMIGTNTGPGTAHATVTCGAGRISRNFVIR
jgi:phosphatidylserine/phosphatidylglycerophosphate/cardiolipin synthase-like enzyme